MNCFLIPVYFLVSLKFLCLLSSLASQRPVLRGNTSHTSKLQAKYSCHLCPPYLPICGISSPLQVNFRVLPLKSSNCFSLCDDVFSSWRSKMLGLLSSILLGIQARELHLACQFNFSKRASLTTPS